MPGNPDTNPPVRDVVGIQTTAATSQINNVKHVPVVTLSTNDNIKFLKNIKQGFKRAISWSQYRSEITTQTKNNSLDYLIDPIFRNNNRLLYFHSKMVIMMLLELHAISRNQRF